MLYFHWCRKTVLFAFYILFSLPGFKSYPGLLFSNEIVLPKQKVPKQNVSS